MGQQAAAVASGEQERVCGAVQTCLGFGRMGAWRLRPTGARYQAYGGQCEWACGSWHALAGRGATLLGQRGGRRAGPAACRLAHAWVRGEELGVTPQVFVTSQAVGLSPNMTC